MQIVQATLYRLSLPLKHPFTTSFGQMGAKQCLILELVDELGHHGFGEGAAFEVPFYTPEFLDGDWALLERQLLPRLLKTPLAHPDDGDALFSYVRHNEMARAAINCALWDLFAQRTGQSLARAIGGTKTQVEAGVSIGIQPSPAELVTKVGDYLAAGYRRIKVKIKLGQDYDYLRAVREAYPNAMLMADANSAYRLSDLPLLKRLDDLDLTMIEQPLGADDLVEHAALQAKLATALCLDESINSLADAATMAKLGSGRIINVKVARVGGLSAAKRIQDFARQHGLECWCGGMLATGIGRAFDLAVATLPGFTLPNDISAAARYFDQDITTPPVTLNGAMIDVPTQVGLGFEVDQAALAKFTTQTVQVNR